MNTAIDYWYIIIALIVLLIIVCIAVFAYLKSPSSDQMRKVKAWLLLAVTEAEKELGTGTGKLKLRYVYDLFIMRFKWTARMISFEVFSELVDAALEEMREMLKNNPAVLYLVNPDRESHDV